MRIATFSALLTCIVLNFVSSSIAEVSLDITDRFQFSMSADGEELIAIDVLSPSSSILPGPRSESGPFQFALAATKGQTTWANLGSNPPLDGEFKLPARWNPTGVPDLTWQYGDQVHGSEPQGPFYVFENPVRSLPDPDISVSLDDQRRFVLTGNGEQLIGITFKSPSGSLVPGPEGDAGPFSFVYENNARELAYGAVGNSDALTLDGTLTLAGGWNPLGSNDVTYHYNQVGPIHSGNLTLPIDASGSSTVTVSLDSEHRVVLNGGDLVVNEIRLTSPSGSLVPAETPAPFEAFAENTPNSIRFVSEQPISLQGISTLNAKWDRILGVADIEFGYSGADVEQSDIRLPGSLYPITPVEAPLTASIHFDTTELSIRGSGQELRDITFTSPSGSLNHYNTSSGPFESVVSSTNQRVEFSTSKFVTIDGTLTLPIRYNVGTGQKDIQFRYEQVGFEFPQGPFELSYPPNLVPLRGSINEDGHMVVQGFGVNARSLKFQSELGALRPSESPAPFASFGSNTVNSIEFLGNVAIDGELTLSAEWNESAGADIEFFYQLVDNESLFGPSDLRYPSANVLTVVAAPSLTNTISIIGDGQLINGIELISDSGSLILSDDPNFGLFNIVEEYSPHHVLLRSSTEIPIDVNAIPVTWDRSGEPDIIANFENAGSRVILSRLIYTESPVVPEPQTALLLLLPILGLLHHSRRHPSDY